MSRDTFRFHPLLRSSDCPDISQSEAMPKILRVGYATSNTVTDRLNVTRVALAHPDKRASRRSHTRSASQR